MVSGVPPRWQDSPEGFQIGHNGGALALSLLPGGIGWPMRRSLVATLEGLSGVIPAALPVSLRQPYQDDLLLHWGPMTLITAVVTVPVSVTPETVCADTFKHWLLVRPARAESALSPQR